MISPGTVVVALSLFGSAGTEPSGHAIPQEVRRAASRTPTASLIFSFLRPPRLRAKLSDPSRRRPFALFTGSGSHSEGSSSSIPRHHQPTNIDAHRRSDEPLAQSPPLTASRGAAELEIHTAKPLGSTITADRGRRGHYLSIIEFDSYESEASNSPDIMLGLAAGQGR
jgi:hypothetical protein